MRVVFACAGTGGHVNPAIAIAKIILKKEKNSEFLFVGTQNGIENKLVANAGFNIKHISTGKLLREVTLKNFKAILSSTPHPFSAQPLKSFSKVLSEILLSTCKNPSSSL